MKNNLVVLTVLFLLIFSSINAQEKRIKGKIIVKDGTAENIHVLNLKNEKSVISNYNGEFEIDVKEDDLLVFSAVNLNYWRRSISANDIIKGYIEVEITQKINALDEVVVTEYVNINAKSLGIINYTPKVYTPAERRLYTATTGSGLIPLDPIINWITGRTKMLKKEIQVEKREMLLEALNGYFENTFYINKLKIPEIYVSGFKYYAVEDPKLSQAINADNADRIFIALSDLSIDFLRFLKEEINYKD